jgi:hypothetical protein
MAPPKVDKVPISLGTWNIYMQLAIAGKRLVHTDQVGPKDRKTKRQTLHLRRAFFDLQHRVAFSQAQSVPGGHDICNQSNKRCPTVRRQVRSIEAHLRSGQSTFDNQFVKDLCYLCFLIIMSLSSGPSFFRRRGHK